MLRALPNSSLHVDSPLGLGQPICCQPAFEDSASLLPHHHCNELVQQLSQERNRATPGPSVKVFSAAAAFPTGHKRHGVKKSAMIYS